MPLKSTLRWAVYLPLFIIPFIPLYVANGMFFPFITGKGFAFRVLVEVALIGYVLLALIDTRYRPRFSWTLAVFGIFTLWMALADMLAKNPYKAFWSNYERMDGWVTLAHLFVFFVVLSSVLTADKLWRKWWLWFLGAASLVCAYGLFQLAGMADIHQGGVRVDSTFGNAAYLAVYLLFVTVIAVWQALESKGALRYVLFVFASISTFILFATATRGAVIGLAGAIGLGSILWMLEAGQKKMRIVAGGILLALIVLTGALFALKETPFIKNEPTLSRVLSISAADGTTRFALWGIAYEGMLERPVFGWGQEGFNYVFQKYYKPSLYAQEPWFDRAHNTFIDWLIAGGIPAFLLFIGLLVSAVVALYRKTVSRPERILLVSALAAYAFQALFVFDNLFSYVPLVALLAAAHAVSGRPIQKLEALPEAGEQTMYAIALPIVAAVGIGMVWMVNIPSIAGATKLVHALSSGQSDVANAVSMFKDAESENGLGGQEIAEQAVSFATALRSQNNVPVEIRTDVLRYAVGSMQTQVNRIPRDARMRVELATGYRAGGDYQSALLQTDEALKLSPKKQSIMLERGFELWEQGKLTEVRDLYVRMYELDTSFPALASYAAAGYIITGDQVAGNAILIKSFGSTVVDNEALVIAYFNAKRYDDLIASLTLHLKNDPSVESYIRLASAYMLANQVTHARSIAEDGLKAHPESAQAIQAFIAQLPK